ncbi:FAD-dependent monooxygenase [Nesterenkonia ebinurensis]|uniref:FAD-dependent monooxygenase n=1 Tax=Nesterenkonia ebinurensis TaxID=2608252 RepID=UPI00123D8263|nr:FAD-dependent monooxygenase [Nesterenkonia ebinurensis]
MSYKAGRRAVVVGGGIAGLTAAASLLRAGWQVRVLERAIAFSEVGAGLGITANGRRALAAIGAEAVLARDGTPIRPVGTRLMDGSWLIKLSAAGQPGTQMYGMHRQRLHAALVEAACGAELSTGSQVVDVRPGDTGSPAVVSVQTDQGEDQVEADFLVAADGLRSPTRKALWPDRNVVASGYTSWRAVIAAPGAVSSEFAMTWGPNAEFGALPVGHGEIYWYGYAKLSPGTVFDDERQAARKRFAKWHDNTQALIAATAADRLMRHDVWLLDRPLKSYVRGRTVLIGDAAHPMLPTLGQGANSALEDGVTVGRVVSPTVEDIPAALREVDRQRRRRTQGLVKQSAAMARLGAHLGPGWKQRVRNAAFRRIPPAMAERSGGGFLNWQVPDQV